MLRAFVFSERPANLSSSSFFTALVVSLFNSHLVRRLTVPAIPLTADKSEVGKGILTLPVAKPRYNAEGIPKTRVLFDYGDIRYITNYGDTRYITNYGDIRYITNYGDIRYITHYGDILYITNYGDIRYITNYGGIRYISNYGYIGTLLITMTHVTLLIHIVAKC
jgi:uncharacterized protein YlbG (UPF0298 family)